MKKSKKQVTPKPTSRADHVRVLIESSIDTFTTKNLGYGDTYILATEVMDLIVPNKSVLKTRFQKLVYHNMYVILCKLCRASSIIFHGGSASSEAVYDTWRDIGVYGFMVEEICRRRG